MPRKKPPHAVANLDMALEFENRRRPAQPIAAWRRERLLDAGFEPGLACELADGRVDLHELIALVESGCPPHLAARILAPLRPQPRAG
jgi:hypothetical protein